MRIHIRTISFLGLVIFFALAIGIQWDSFTLSQGAAKQAQSFDDVINQNAEQTVKDGRQIFRFDIPTIVT